MPLPTLHPSMHRPQVLCAPPHPSNITCYRAFSKHEYHPSTALVLPANRVVAVAQARPVLLHALLTGRWHRTSSRWHSTHKHSLCMPARSFHLLLLPPKRQQVSCRCLSSQSAAVGLSCIRLHIPHRKHAHAWLAQQPDHGEPIKTGGQNC